MWKSHDLILPPLIFHTQGAWVLMTECDYVWMAPAKAPGNAYNKDVPGAKNMLSVDRVSGKLFAVAVCRSRCAHTCSYFDVCHRPTPSWLVGLSAGEQYFYDYIIPQHPDAAVHIKKLLGAGVGIRRG